MIKRNGCATDHHSTKTRLCVLIAIEGVIVRATFGLSVRERFLTIFNVLGILSRGHLRFLILRQLRIHVFYFSHRKDLSVYGT